MVVPPFPATVAAQNVQNHTPRCAAVEPQSSTIIEKLPKHFTNSSSHRNHSGTAGTLQRQCRHHFNHHWQPETADCHKLKPIKISVKSLRHFISNHQTISLTASCKHRRINKTLKLFSF